MSIKNRIKNIQKSEYWSISDLHTHSNFSDGKENFSDILISAKKLGYKNFAICDHNTVQGYIECNWQNYEFLIPAVEFDVLEDFILVHIIGYGIDPNHPSLQMLCAKHDYEKNHVLPRLFNSRRAKDVIEGIHASGGIAVLAHPCCLWAINLNHFVKKLKKMELDGIETYYPYRKLRGIIKFHDEKKIEKLAEKYDLIKTGGTDCHGKLGEN